MLEWRTPSFPQLFECAEGDIRLSSALLSQCSTSSTNIIKWANALAFLSHVSNCDTSNQHLVLISLVATIQIAWKTTFRRSASRIPKMPRFSPFFLVGVLARFSLASSHIQLIISQKQWNNSIPPWWTWWYTFDLFPLKIVKIDLRSEKRLPPILLLPPF